MTPQQHSLRLSRLRRLFDAQRKASDGQPRLLSLLQSLDGDEDLVTWLQPPQLVAHVCAQLQGAAGAAPEEEEEVRVSWSTLLAHVRTLYADALPDTARPPGVLAGGSSGGSGGGSGCGGGESS
ncbi:MAG: hypothetical protein ACK4NM_18710, partial [Hydrogenophaga sp.]